MLGEDVLDEAPHHGLRGVIGFRHRIEAAGAGLVVRRKHRAKEGQDRLAGHMRQLLDEFLEIDRRHALPQSLIHLRDAPCPAECPSMQTKQSRSRISRPGRPSLQRRDGDKFVSLSLES